MAFGLSSNPIFGMHLLECSLYVLTCLRVSAVISHIPWVIPFLIATLRQNSTLLRSQNFCRDRTLERLRMGAKRKDLFYYLVSSHVDLLSPSFHRMR